MFKKVENGFTLAELLVALLILGVIATFTIPKVLNAGKSGARYSKAQEVAATLGAILQAYTLENGGCVPGMTCRYNRSNGTPLDGGDTHSDPSSTPTAYNALQSYLDKKLNYIKKIPYSGYPGCNLYLLPNGTVVGINSIDVLNFTPTKYDIAAGFFIILDTTLANADAGNYSVTGVDTQNAYVYAFSNGALKAGSNSLLMSQGNPYDPTYADVFDLKSHPNDTCTALGGTNCGM